jgi:hypothetical protein
VLTDFDYLAYTRRVNNPGIVQFGIRGDHPILSNIADNWQVEVWRKPEDEDWTREIVGLYRKLTWSFGEQSNAVITCNGLLSMLNSRIVAWYTATNNRSKYTTEKAETIGNLIVKYNCTADATVANGRLREGAISGLTVEPDGGEGNSIDFYCAYANVLEALKKLSLVGGGDFDLVKTSSTTWQYRWYTGQLGTDRTASIIFALNFGNMSNPVYEDDRMNEITAAIVAGQGELSDRALVIRTGTNYHAVTNNIETFVAATDITTIAGLNSRGDEKLLELEARKSFRFDVLQTPSGMYGKHYTLGDLVVAINPFTNVELTQKISAISVSINQAGEESISIETETP